MKADMEAMKDQMATMMEAMLSMKKIMENNATAVAVTSAAVEVDPTHPSGLIQVNPLVSDIVGQGGEALGSTGGPHVVQSNNSFPSYNLPPNYAAPNVVPVLEEDTDNFAPIPIEGEQPEFDHAHVSLMEACLCSFYGGWIFELQCGPSMVIFHHGDAAEGKGE